MAADPSPGAGADPRVYFAAERTLLAWLRTGITLMGFGFVVARSGLLLALIAQGGTKEAQGAQPPATGHWSGIALGVVLVLAGSASCLIASWQFNRFLGGLGEAERPVRYLTACGPWVAYAVALLGVVLAVHLLC